MSNNYTAFPNYFNLIFYKSKLKRISLIIISLMISLTLQSCNKTSATLSEDNIQIEGKLVLTGSSTVAPLLTEIGRQFEKENPNVRIDVQTGGSSRGIADTRSGVANIGMVSRDLKEEEQDLLSFTIAKDGIGIIVHQDNPITSLSNEEIVDIYTGKINNWQEVNGNNSGITVVNKAEAHSTLELFLNYFKLQNSKIKASVIIGDNQQGIKTVAGNPNAIGYISIGAAEFSITEGVAIKLLPLNGIEATSENISNGTFPLSRPLNLVIKSQSQDLEKIFIEFSRSSEVHDLIKEQDFVPIPRPF